MAVHCRGSQQTHRVVIYLACSFRDKNSAILNEFCVLPFGIQGKETNRSIVYGEESRPTPQ